jgi:hypothetical protein
MKSSFPSFLWKKKKIKKIQHTATEIEGDSKELLFSSRKVNCALQS